MVFRLLILWRRCIAFGAAVWESTHEHRQRRYFDSFSTDSHHTLREIHHVSSRPISLSSDHFSCLGPFAWSQFELKLVQSAVTSLPLRSTNKPTEEMIFPFFFSFFSRFVPFRSARSTSIDVCFKDSEQLIVHTHTRNAMKALSPYQNFVHIIVFAVDIQRERALAWCLCTRGAHPSARPCYKHKQTFARREILSFLRFHPLSHAAPHIDTQPIFFK